MAEMGKIAEVRNSMDVWVGDFELPAELTPYGAEIVAEAINLEVARKFVRRETAAELVRVLKKYRPVIKGEDITSPGTVGAIYEWDEALAAYEREVQA